MLLPFDTETTGLPSKTFKPRIVQIAAVLMGDDQKHIHTINTLIKPDGWTIPAEATAIHGKTTEMCEEHGRTMKQVLEEFNDYKAMAKTRIAHNLYFDKMMMAIEEEIYNVPHNSSNIESYCTMQKSKNIVKCPPTEKMKARGINSYKVPSLQESYRHFFGVEFDGAHDAMNDLCACIGVYFKLKELGI